MKTSFLSLNSIGRAIFIFVIFIVIPKISLAQYSTGFQAGTNIVYLYVGSLGPSNAGNFQKMEVDILGGGWTSTTLGKTVYTIANRDNLIINQTTEGGSNGGNFTMKAYSNSNGNTDFYLMTIGSYPAFAINSVILNGSVPQTVSITQSSTPPSETDITPTINPIIVTDQNGNIALNTTSTQGYKFAVNGTAIATSMTVKLYPNWPDYVFKPTYSLMPLSEIKKYVNENNHLPDFPSAKEVANKGLNLGETDRLLTQKMEELTLYLITKDDEVKSLKQQLNTQSEQLKAQQQQLDQLKTQLSSLLKQQKN